MGEKKVGKRGDGKFLLSKRKVRKPKRSEESPPSSLPLMGELNWWLPWLKKSQILGERMQVWKFLLVCLNKPGPNEGKSLKSSGAHDELSKPHGFEHLSKVSKHYTLVMEIWVFQMLHTCSEWASADSIFNLYLSYPCFRIFEKKNL